MKKSFCLNLAFAGLVLLAVPGAGRAEVRRVELDIAGYLCGG